MGIFDKISGRIGDIVDEVMIPEDLHRRHESAARAIDRGDTSDALSILKPTLVERPNIARTHYLIGRAHGVAEDWSEAIEAFERALAIRESSRAHLDCGLACEKAGKLRDAERHLRRALEIEEDPSSAFDIHLNLGRVNLELDRPDRAARELRRALKVIENDTEAAVLLARALMRRGSVDEAFEVLERHVPDPGIDSRAANQMARIHEVRGKLEQALEHFEKALSRDPEDVEALTGAGRVSLALNAPSKALSWLNRALEAGPATPTLHALRARALEDSGDIEEAARAFRKALELDPSTHEASLGLGRIELERDNADVAGGYFQAAIATVEPSVSKEALWGLGASRRIRGDLAGARHMLDEAQRISATTPGLDARIWRDLGDIALELGDAAQAVLSYQEARTDDSSLDVEERMIEALEVLSFDWELPEDLDGPFELTSLLRQLVQYLANDARLSEFLPVAQELLARMDAPLSLAIVGEFNAGKSTMVNALIGEDVLPMGVLPTTAHTGILRFGPRRAARINYIDGRRVEVGFDEARKLMKTDAEDIDRLEFIYPHPTLRIVEYWDTPGFNAMNERHEEVAAEALARAEAILWVMDASQVLSQTEFDLIDSVPDGDERLVVVINKIDRLGTPTGRQDAIEELTEYVDDNIGDQIAGCFPISALQAHEGGEDAASSGFDAFKTFLDERILQRAGRIKTVEVGRNVEAFLVTLDAFQKGLRQRYESMSEEVDALIEWVGAESESIEAEAARASTELADQIDFMLAGIEKEIADALRPGGTILNRLTLNEEDRGFLIGLMHERLETVLDRAIRSRLDAHAAFESTIAERLDPVLRGLSVQDARAMDRRVEGFFDECQTLKALLQERVFGQYAARAIGRIDAAGMSTLDTIQAAQSDRSVWRPALERLMPPVDQGHTERLETWLEEYFEHARRFLNRVKSDLDLLELDARHRYDVDDLMALLS